MGAANNYGFKFLSSFVLCECIKTAAVRFSVHFTSNQDLFFCFVTLSSTPQLMIVRIGWQYARLVSLGILLP